MSKNPDDGNEETRPNTPPLLNDAPPIVYSTKEERYWAIVNKLESAISHNLFDQAKDLLSEITHPHVKGIRKDPKNALISPIPAIDKYTLLVNLTNEAGHPLLHQAVTADAKEITELFLKDLSTEQKRTLITQQDSTGKTPLDIAFSREELLTSSLASLQTRPIITDEDKDTQRTLIGKIRQNTLLTYSLLVEAYEAKDLVDHFFPEDRRMKLSNALRTGDTNAIEILLEDIPSEIKRELSNKLSSEPKNASLAPLADLVLDAVKMDDPELLSVLLSKTEASEVRSFLNTQDTKGHTLLHKASEFGSLNAAQDMLRLGSNPALRATDPSPKGIWPFKKGMTAADLAHKNEEHELGYRLQNAKNIQQGRPPVKGAWTESVTTPKPSSSPER